MKTHRGVIAAALVAALVTMIRPGEVLAERSCTETYVRCIVEAGYLDEPFTTMADIECFAEYTGCVAKKLKFW